jgi:hypothetical protein
MQHAPVGGVHDVVAHAVPAPRKNPCAAAHAASVRSWQLAPVVLGMQHAPVGGCGQLAVAHAVPAPRNTPWAAAQSADVVAAQCPSGKQHAPASGVHVVLAHVVPSPWYVPLCDVQSACVSAWHSTAPLALKQHAPVVGCGQFAVAHAVPFPRYTPWSVPHCVSLTSTHIPLDRQHAPNVGAHVVVAQVVFAPRKIP